MLIKHWDILKTNNLRYRLQLFLRLSLPRASCQHRWLARNNFGNKRKGMSMQAELTDTLPKKKSKTESIKIETDDKIESHDGVKAVLSGDTFGGFKIEGISIAGQETCIILPDYSVVFDSGRCPQKSCFQPNVLISHAHLDHIGGLPFIIATRAMHGLEPAKIYLPEEISSATQKVMDAFGHLGGAVFPTCLNSCKPGQEFKIKPQIIAEPFRTVHSILSQGYLLRTEKQKLKAEFLGLPGKEIKRLKDKGVEITQTVRTPLIAFTGDTTLDYLNGNLGPEILNAKLLIMEITTLDDLLSPQETKARGHTHLEHVLENAERFQNAAILIIHVSSRYSKTEALEILNRSLPEDLKRRCGVLLESFK